MKTMTHAGIKFRCMKPAPYLDNYDCDRLTRAMQWPLFGSFYRHRFEMVLRFLAPPVTKVLEIGYGAGFLAYALAPYVGAYVGIDLHGHAARVADAFKKQGITNVAFRTADARDLTMLPTGAFDVVVSVSCLEHIAEHAQVQQQISRMLSPGGYAVYGMPVKNTLTRMLFKGLGYNDARIHPTTHVSVVESAKNEGLILDIESFFPAWAQSFFPLYWAGRFSKRKTQ
ncbi:MAG: class I SAM-dependent methyltransferase [Candidatus Omnitrophica bacterium]|nr:class I SAM-dependent methyltransferase [Candidatus Omnitrophota bacterium]